MGKYLLFILGIISLTCFFSPQKVKAENINDVAGNDATIIETSDTSTIDPVVIKTLPSEAEMTDDSDLLEEATIPDSKVIINEVMANPLGTDSGNEWLEIANFSNEENIENWTLSIYNNIVDPPKIIILPNKVILKDDFYVYNFSTRTLNNSNVKIILSSPDGLYKYQFEYTEDVGDGYSMEVVDPLIKGWKKSLIIGGTPGASNSVSESPLPPPSPVINNAPNPFNLISPENRAALKTGQDINFLWETSTDSDGNEVSYSLYLGCSDNFSPADLVVSGQIEKNYSYSTTKICQEYYWQIVASDGFLETLSNEIRSFTPIYSKNIIVNEILPHPSGGVNNEFIELYNSGSESVDLSKWFVDDNGGTKSYLIPAGTIIEPNGYLVFYKTVTGLSLSDSGDSGRLLFPDGSVASTCTYSEYASLDLAWARGDDGKWNWTEKITPGKANIIYITPADDSASDKSAAAQDDVPVNSTPIEIKTGDFRDFVQKLVALEGTVISTSGNTFFVDDGTGAAKIYIQDKTNIQKPPMHKGDTFAVIGIIDLYRAVWRILPQKQSDVKLIHCVKDDKTTLAKIVKSSSVVSASKETLVGDNATNQARAPTVTDSIIKQVKAADISAPAPNSITQTQTKNSIWGQIAKALTSLSVIFMVLLMLKVKKIPKVKVIGGHFGSDDT